jgi:hypothetical protein
VDNQFDVLAKTIALAGGMPRREAVRRLGGAFASAALASLGVGCSGGRSSTSVLPTDPSFGGRAAQGTGNVDCATFCLNVPAGPQRGQCVADATNHSGLCYQCGGNAKLLCAPSGGRSVVCCTAGTTPACCAGTCTDVATDVNNCGTCGNKCASGQSCTNGTCVTACIADGARGCISAADCCSFSTGVACCVQGVCGHGQPACAL